MRRLITKPLIPLLLFLALPAAAQDNTVIDVFDNQDELPESSVTIDRADGASAGDPAWQGTSTGRADGGLTIRYEKEGSSILVPVDVEGRTAYFIYDTGATYTTLTPAFARSVGLTPKNDYPRGISRTANGPREMRYGLINSLRIGGRTHSGVTFALCEGCPSGVYKGKPIVGLLGMNVLGRYRVTIDHSAGAIEMVAGSGYMDRARDIEPWIRVRYDDGVRSGKSLFFVGRVTNRAPRAIQKMTLRFQCEGGEPVYVSKKIASGATQKFKSQVTSGDCIKDFQARVVESRW